jgi:ABC-type uncharacterized transport system ATPase subunit
MRRRPVQMCSPSNCVASTSALAPVHANKHIDLKVARQSIHGIVGENGAGKSTLMSILYGFYEADEGDIFVGGKKVSIRSSNDAIAHGIGMVHQHFMLVDNFTVIENVMLGAEGAALLQAGRDKVRKDLKYLSEDLRPDGRSGRHRLGAFGRPAAARGNPQGALSRRRYSDPG